MLKPIQTYYDRYLFRSRLEARYAVCFNHIGLKYEYEPEGYNFDNVGTRTVNYFGDYRSIDLNVGYYLPDFRFTDVDDWLEIKGVEPNELEFRRLLALAFSSNRGHSYCFAGNIGDHKAYHAYRTLKAENSELAIYTIDPYLAFDLIRNERYSDIPDNLDEGTYTIRLQARVRLNRNLYNDGLIAGRMARFEHRNNE